MDSQLRAVQISEEYDLMSERTRSTALSMYLSLCGAMISHFITCASTFREHDDGVHPEYSGRAAGRLHGLGVLRGHNPVAATPLSQLQTAHRGTQLSVEQAILSYDTVNMCHARGRAAERG